MLRTFVTRSEDKLEKVNVYFLGMLFFGLGPQYACPELDKVRNLVASLGLENYKSLLTFTMFSRYSL